MHPNEQIPIIIAAFREGLQSILGAKLHAAYVYGAAAFPDSLPTGDIDFHVILNGRLTGLEKQALEDMHAALARKYPPLGIGMDGYYILVEDAKRRTPPKSEMWAGATDHAWALHREHIRAGRYISIQGGDPLEIYLPSTWTEIDEALQQEVAYIRAHLDQYPDYCILNLCRLIYSYQTKDVVISKAKAAEWSFQALPEWRWLVDLAWKSYEGAASPEDRALMVKGVSAFFAFAKARIDPLRYKDEAGKS